MKHNQLSIYTFLPDWS